MNSDSIQHEVISLEQERVVVHFKGRGSLTLLQGSASVLCAPLQRNVRYWFENQGVPIDAPGTTARLDVEGNYTWTSTVLNGEISELHAVVDEARARARMYHEAGSASSAVHSGGNAADEARGPRVLIVGDQNTGKTSLARALVNMATRTAEYGVAYVDVDVGQQSVSVAGSIATVFCESPIPVDEGLNSAMPLCFFFGDTAVNIATRKRYLDLCLCSAQACASVAASRPSFAAGGLVINTMGWIADLGKDLLMELLSIFSATHVIVCGADSDLETTIQNAALGRPLRVLRYSRQSDILVRGASILKAHRQRQLLTYLCGTARNPLTVVRSVAKVSDVTFLSALTLDTLSWQDVKPLSLVAVSLANCVEEAGEANVAGYIVIIDMGKKLFSFLSPSPDVLPRPYLLVSSTIKLPASSVPPINAT